MKNKSFLIKILLIITALLVELVYVREFTGLIFLTVFFGGILLWNTIYFFRYSLFLLLSAIILVPTAYVLHSHFYDWQKEAKRPMVRQLSNVIEDIVLHSDQKTLESTINRLFNKSNRRYARYHVKITALDGTIITPDNVRKRLQGPNVTRFTVSSRAKHVKITYEQKHRDYWGWKGTYVWYWRALLKAEVIFSNPPKYRDYFMVHLVILLVVVNVYLQLNFRRNYLRSKYLMEQLSTVIKDKKTV